MTTLQLEGKDSSQGTQQTQDDRTRKDIRATHERALGLLKSIGKQEDTSAEEQEETYYTSFLAYAALLSDVTFREQIVLPLTRMFEAIVRAIPTIGETLEQLLEQAKEEEEEEEEYGILHDYVLDDLSVDYDSAKKFHEHLMSLRRHYERTKRSSK